MAAVTLDLGQIPSVLRALRDPGNAQLVANAAAERYVTDIHDLIDARRSFTGRTGQLQQSINWRPAGGGSAEVYANAEYAAFVERGTCPHVIRPRSGRKALKIPVSGGGGYIIRRSVNHPGSRPFPFFFADMSARNEHMLDAMRSVLASVIDHG